MRDYEVVYIFKSSLTTEEIEGRLEGYHGRILALAGSEITAVEHWGKRQLAFPIDRNDNGYYVVTQFTASPAVLPDFERMLKLDDDLLRHLVVLSEGELPVPVQYERGDEDRGGRGRRDDDEVRKKAADKVPEDGDAAEEETETAEDDAEAAEEAADAAEDDADAVEDDVEDDSDDAGDDDDADATRRD
ncbi:MAG: 30S ribosomal protein S6 [Gemmatimonadetes bacterium]|nr:30S ribosomal protein S6 [Gemmatimonadota bacterium]